MEKTRLKREPLPLTQAMDRVAVLRKPYTRAVQRLIVDGDPLGMELLVRAVDVAQEYASAALTAWRCGEATEHDAVHAHDVVARLMVKVVRRAR